MAREAGIYKDCDWRYGMKAEGDSLKAFEALVRADAIADEREACAKVCESNVWSKDVAWWQEATKSEVSVESSIQCAAAIRARGEASIRGNA
jgi:hypothetical protein